jgi:hypothetical protein
VAAVPATTAHEQPPQLSRPLEKAPPRIEQGRRSHTVLWAAAIFTGVLIGTAAALSMWPTPPNIEVSRAGVSEGTTSAQGHDDWQLGAVAAGAALKSKKPAAASATRTGARPRVTDAASPVAATPDGHASLVPPVATLARNAPPAPARPPLPPTPDFQATPAGVPANAATAAPAIAPADPTIYSEQDRDVSPPVLLSKRPTAPPAAALTDSQVSSTMELVIDVSGHVASVKLMERPTRLTDTLPLQEAKNLRFAPAVKDGNPVQYRYLLRTVASPR